MPMLSAADFFGGLIFGSIGLAALVYGKKALLPKKMILGATLMICSYVVTPAWLLWLVGSALTWGLIGWKD